MWGARVTKLEKGAMSKVSFFGDVRAKYYGDKNDDDPPQNRPRRCEDVLRTILEVEFVHLRFQAIIQLHIFETSFRVKYLSLVLYALKTEYPTQGYVYISFSNLQYTL